MKEHVICWLIVPNFCGKKFKLQKLFDNLQNVLVF